METSLSEHSEWFDREFFELGAFLGTSSGEKVLFAKGGSISEVSEFSTTQETVFYLKDFYRNTYLAYRPRTILSLNPSEVPTLQVEHSHFSPVSNDDDIYEKDFERLKNSFGPSLQKVVLISRETYGSFEGEKSIRHLFNRAFSFGTGQPYGIWNKNYGVIGSTPELLYSVTKNTLRTFALAGTAKINEGQKLLESSKDRHEHNLVIQDISEKLKSLGAEIYVQETKLHPYKTIVHLKTDIEGNLGFDTNLTELTNLLSPTAALGGYPKENSLNFLKSSSYSRVYPKRYFGSALGVINPEMKEFVVAIRNVQWEKGHYFIESGGGVVPESELKKEMDEIHLKRSTIQRHYL